MRRRLGGLFRFPKPIWLSRVAERVRGRDARFTDEDVLQTLRAGETGVRVSDLCSAANISLETYCRWKVKYAGLTLPELSRRRIRERRLYRAVAALAALLVLGMGCVAVVQFNARLRPSAAAKPPRAASNQPAPVKAMPPPALARAASGPERGNPRVEALAPAPREDHGDVMAADPDGYAVQVAAMVTIKGARDVRERLKGAGYPVYLTPGVAGQLEVYRVRVGPFESRQLAEEAARRLEVEGHRGVWITR